ncbi:MAG TPA: DEAD/DEAH box helicase, partial [Pyrinomonadaceae bacterium]|nr:DEAD/DEAH box helicase [Pyrinomonadaceae bacterium]
HHLSLLDQLLADDERAKTDKEFKRRREHLRNFAGIKPQKLPKYFNGELRPYQKAGFDWLHFLREYKFGGCLADDMGTGKTIATLAFLQSLKERGLAKKASLLVVPRSLVFNWEREAARFTPRLRLLNHATPARTEDISDFDDYDLVLTTYGLLRRDVEMLMHYDFNYLILDEAQAIKNPLAETAKAVRLLRGAHRLTLTGTPVENNTLELWSQFAFLNPGLLGNAEYFHEEFSTPIERKGDEQAAQFLRKMVYPFILRRTKDQIAKDLPPRTERQMVCDMEPAQRKLYNEKRDYYRALLLKLIEDEGINNARFRVLKGLLRLRQICNHPRLAVKTFRGGSAKFELLLETLETLRAEGHKALVFSQFVGMLKLLQAELKKRRIPFSYLDGQTRDRQQRVDAFQMDETIPFFLISLKAGGVGLNLTAADYVIHIDPWWNPAVEMQATDRTHRIGQDKPVFIYKLIERDSVEEKILQLQERKRALVTQLIATESSFFKSLTANDVAALFS